MAGVGKCCCWDVHGEVPQRGCSLRNLPVSPTPVPERDVRLAAWQLAVSAGASAEASWACDNVSYRLSPAPSCGPSPPASHWCPAISGFPLYSQIHSGLSLRPTGSYLPTDLIYSQVLVQCLLSRKLLGHLNETREWGRASGRKAPLCTVGTVGRNETTVTPPQISTKPCPHQWPTSDETEEHRCPRTPGHLQGTM